MYPTLMGTCSHQPGKLSWDLLKEGVVDIKLHGNKMRSSVYVRLDTKNNVHYRFTIYIYTRDKLYIMFNVAVYSRNYL